MESITTPTPPEIPITLSYLAVLKNIGQVLLILCTSSCYQQVHRDATSGEVPDPLLMIMVSRMSVLGGSHCLESLFRGNFNGERMGA